MSDNGIEDKKEYVVSYVIMDAATGEVVKDEGRYRTLWVARWVAAWRRYHYGDQSVVAEELDEGCYRYC